MQNEVITLLEYLITTRMSLSCVVLQHVYPWHVRHYNILIPIRSASVPIHDYMYWKRRQGGFIQNAVGLFKFAAPTEPVNTASKEREAEAIVATGLCVIGFFFPFFIFPSPNTNKNSLGFSVAYSQRT